MILCLIFKILKEESKKKAAEVFGDELADLSDDAEEENEENNEIEEVTFEYYQFICLICHTKSMNFKTWNLKARRRNRAWASY